MINLSEIAFLAFVVCCMTVLQGFCIYCCFKKYLNKNERENLLQESPNTGIDQNRLEEGLLHAILLGPVVTPLLLSSSQQPLKIQNTAQDSPKVLKKH